MHAQRPVALPFHEHHRRRALVRPWSRLPDEELASAFLKPTDSQRYARLFGTKGSFVRSRAAAGRLVAEATAAGVGVMLQEWIPGGPSATILIDGFVDRAGSLKAMVAR